jgi:hypothetical protein
MGRTTHLDPEVTVALQGTLDTFALPDVLRLLAATKKTGQLRITSGRGAGSVWVDGGDISGIEAPHAPHATEPTDALFELLRFEEGSFTFDADATRDVSGAAEDIEVLLSGAEALLVEWRQIEAVVPSLDAWVTLRRTLATPEVSVDQSSWTTIVAVGSGATVRRMSEHLGLSELPVSRVVRDLVELGLADVELSAPSGVQDDAPAAEQLDTEPDAASIVAEAEAPEAALKPLAPVRRAPDADDHAPDDGSGADAPLPVARPLRARRVARTDRVEAGQSPEHFVPLDLPGQGPGPSYERIEGEDDTEVAPLGMDDLAAAFPGLSNRSVDPTPDDEELARQLATLSPRAAEAVRAAAEATTAEERDAALDAADQSEDEPINRGLLLKFLSSVKS